jgi:hypothetical protein
MSFPFKAWVRFYFKLTLIAAWNGVIQFAYVAFGAGGAQLTGAVDLRTLGVPAAGWVFLGTVVANIAGAWYRHRIADPAEPGSLGI